MDQKIEKQIIFGLLIIIIVLFSFSQIFPWFSIKDENNELLTFYSWGGKSESSTAINNTIGFYLLEFFEVLDSISKTPNEMSRQISFQKNLAFGFLFLFVAWLLSILLIIFSICAFYKLYFVKDDEMMWWIVTTSLTSIILFFLFYITSNFLIFDLLKNKPLKEQTYLFTHLLETHNLNIHWEIGFILFILGVLMITGLTILFASKRFSKRISLREQKKETVEKTNKND